MKTDRELLELAARAAGKRFAIDDEIGFAVIDEYGFPAPWNPLASDGDALRLAVKLGLIVEPGQCWHSTYGPAFGEDLLVGEMTATRRAIVRAAAAIGEGMQ